MEGPSTQAKPGPGLTPAPAYWAAIGIGLVALAISLLRPGLLDAVPVGGLWANLALLAGLLGFFLLLFEDEGRAVGDRLLVVLTPALAAAVLARLLYMDPGTSQTVILREPAVPEVTATALALGLTWTLARSRPLGWTGAAWVTGLVATGVAAALAIVHVLRIQPVAPGARTVLIVTLMAVVAILVLQWALARTRSGSRVGVLATGAGLAVVAGHVLDGVVSYLAVTDALGVLGGGLAEGVLVSRWILENAGPLFPLVKWALGAGIMVALEPPHGQPSQTPGRSGAWWHRTVVLVLVLFAGLGPGLFSTLQLLHA